MVELLERVLGILVSVLTAVGIIRGQTEHSAQEHYKYELLGYELANAGYLLDSTSGLAALRAQLDLLTHNGDYGLNDVLNAIADTQQTGQPVTLPSTFPGGWATPLAADVWAYFPSNWVHDGVHIMEDVGRVASAMRNHALWPPRDWYGVAAMQMQTDTSGEALTAAAMYLDLSLALAGETLLAYCNRRFTDYSWNWAAETGSAVEGYGASVLPQYARTTITGREWDAALAQYNGASPLTTANVAPVWPGLAGVTLLTPVTITPPGDVINAACHGVLLDITTVPSWAGSFSFGADTSYRNIGAIAFQSDNGQDEFPIQLGWTAGVYLPKAMAWAAKVAYRAAIGVGGTITPFTIP